MPTTVSLGVSLWITDHSDVEGYFCQPEFLCTLLGCDNNEAETYIVNIVNHNVQNIQDQFAKHRRAHNDEVYAAVGGSPGNADVWAMLETRPLKGAKGKFIFNQLKNIVPGNHFSTEKVHNHTLGGNMALSLRQHLQSLLEN